MGHNKINPLLHCEGKWTRRILSPVVNFDEKEDLRRKKEVDNIVRCIILYPPSEDASITAAGLLHTFEPPELPSWNSVAAPSEKKNHTSIYRD